MYEIRRPPSTNAQGFVVRAKIGSASKMWRFMKSSLIGRDLEAHHTAFCPPSQFAAGASWASILICPFNVGRQASLSLPGTHPKDLDSGGLYDEALPFFPVQCRGWSNSTATRLEICTKSIEYLSNEERLVNEFQEISRCCSPADGWNRFFIKNLTSRLSPKKSEVPENICRRCLETFIHPKPELLLLQAQERSLEHELTILGGKLRTPGSWSITDYVIIFIGYYCPPEPFDELVVQFLGGILRASDFFKAIFDFFWVLLVFDTPFLLEKIQSNITTRRPPRRRRRRSCLSVSNPRPQPSILSENLSRFAVSVRQSSRPLDSG